MRYAEIKSDRHVLYRVDEIAQPVVVRFPRRVIHRHRVNIDDFDGKSGKLLLEADKSALSGLMSELPYAKMHNVRKHIRVHMIRLRFI